MATNQHVVPMGYRFRPTEVELISVFLKSKLDGHDLPQSKIHEVNIYEFDPDHLSQRYLRSDEDDDEVMYFLTPRNKKYKGGKRPNRSAREGYWKATGRDIPVKNINQIVGYRKSLVYYTGKQPRGTKTDWLMREYTLVNQSSFCQSSNDTMKLDDCVLCKIYKRPSKSTRQRSRNDSNEDVLVQSPDASPQPLPGNELPAIADHSMLVYNQPQMNYFSGNDINIGDAQIDLPRMDFLYSHAPVPALVDQTQPSSDAYLEPLPFHSSNELPPLPYDDSILFNSQITWPASLDAQYDQPQTGDIADMFFNNIDYEFIGGLDQIFSSPPPQLCPSQDEDKDKGHQQFMDQIQLPINTDY